MPFISPSWPSDLPEPQVYKNLSSLIIRAIQKTSLPDNDLSKNGYREATFLIILIPSHEWFRHWTTLGDCLRQMSGFDIVHSLVQSTKFRDSLYHVLKDVPHRDKMQEREAIVKDETDIVSLFGRVLDSDEQKEVVFSLQGDEADSFMILAQTILDDWSKLHRMSLSHSGGGADKSDLFFNFNEKFRRDVHKLQINLSLRCQQLPSSICVLGVQLRSKDSARGGSFADVFQGGLGETEVALKRLRVSHDSRRNQLSIQKMLFKEALMWQTLKHRYILPFLGIDAVSFVPMYCMVSPWMRHGDILKFLETSASMQVDIDELVCFSVLIHFDSSMEPLQLLEITEGLNYLHQSGMIHGDLRGSNILIDDDHHPRLADFGLATIADVTKGASSTNHGGSSQWMAPELHFPDKFNLPLKRTFASDVYALGCVYLEVYTRNQPFPSCSEGQLILKLNEGFRPKRPTPVQCMERTLSDALWSLIENCWSEIAAERPSTGMALRAMEDICKRTETTPTNECPPLPEVTSGLLTYPPTRHLSALPATENSTEQRWPPGTMDLSPISSNPIQAHAQEFCVICHIRPKYSFGDIKYDFCSDTCAAEWDRTCGISGCEQPVIRDGAQAFEVCFKHYEMFRANFCLFCRTNCRMWDTLDDPFCADPCARAAVASAPILLEVPNTHPMFTRVAESFGESWGGESKTPVVARVFRVISSSQVQDMHESFRQGIISSRSLGQTSGNQDRRWYGPRCACTLGQSQPTGICSSNTCGICCMMTSSAYTSGEITSWRRFGSGFYTSSTASK
ncbi:hypothetical protein JAAARDRAFT_436255 [Jaapia argillacea MUCL 33604]|uniref:Protein kinase domain-containing protein n=1 Tax=Jaapia argillacea MUCL 33604 TaxID=933084 RepID=A0A067PS49_9AGAM|nr:hypothetical protein JAAARDRAFT_436255 [Jaapia argillacea MUCL 33604]